MDRHMGVMSEIEEMTGAPPTPQMFGNAGREHMKKYGKGSMGYSISMVRLCLCWLNDTTCRIGSAIIFSEIFSSR